MDEQKKGRLTLKAVPEGKAEEKVVAYLAQLFRKTSPERLAILVKRTPLLLSRNVSARTAKRIIDRLQALGALAVFSPHPSGSYAAFQNQPRTFNYEELSRVLLDAVRGPLPRVPATVFYRFGLLLVSSAMLFLVLLYLGSIAFVSGLVFWHVTVNAVWLERVHSPVLAAAVFFGPLLVGLLLLFFMVKPLAFRGVQSAAAQRLSPESEPLFFAYLRKICTVIGAPVPSAVFADPGIHVSVHSRGRLQSAFRDDPPVLIVGLPLVRRVNLLQFSGLLAHECGHDADVPGRRLVRCIRNINSWFQSVAYEDDGLDTWIQKQNNTGATILRPFLAIATMFTSSTRAIFRVLMILGHLLSSPVLRQSEYDADCYSMQLIGSAAFESVFRRITALSLAHTLASSKVSLAWNNGCLADDFSSILVAEERTLADGALKEALQAQFSTRKTGFAHVHPTYRERIIHSRRVNAAGFLQLPVSHPALRFRMEAARKADTMGIFSTAPPASILFRDYETYSRMVSLEWYRQLLGKTVDPKNFVSLEPILRLQEEEISSSRALQRFCQGQLNSFRRLGLLDDTAPLMPALPADICAAIQTQREDIASLAPEYTVLLKQYQNRESSIAQALQTQALMDAGIKIPLEAVKEMNNAFAMMDAPEPKETAKFRGFEELVRNRIIGDIQLLSHPTVSGLLADSANLARRIDQCLIAARALEREFPVIKNINHSCIQVHALLSMREQNPTGKVDQHIRVRVSEMRDALQQLRDRLAPIQYPLGISGTLMNLAETSIAAIPSTDEVEACVKIAADAVEKLMSLYQRLIGHLAQTAEDVESALGLPMLPDVAVCQRLADSHRQKHECRCGAAVC
ncbi:MAG TPA: hypothetical protein PKJ77_08345 [Thermodesulfobacteriota bacterium]|nr:hypothetical protein [Thermodesulfobacteriota bacterium]